MCTIHTHPDCCAAIADFIGIPHNGIAHPLIHQPQRWSVRIHNRGFAAACPNELYPRKQTASFRRFWTYSLLPSISSCGGSCQKADILFFNSFNGRAIAAHVHAPFFPSCSIILIPNPLHLRQTLRQKCRHVSKPTCAATRIATVLGSYFRNFSSGICKISGAVTFFIRQAFSNHCWVDCCHNRKIRFFLNKIAAASVSVKTVTRPAPQGLLSCMQYNPADPPFRR